MLRARVESKVTSKGGKGPKTAAPVRSRRARAMADLIPEAGGAAFRRFGFVQSSIVSRWREIVGPRYAAVAAPESIRFPARQEEQGRAQPGGRGCARADDAACRAGDRRAGQSFLRLSGGRADRDPPGRGRSCAGATPCGTTVAPADPGRTGRFPARSRRSRIARLSGIACARAHRWRWSAVGHDDPPRRPHGEERKR